MLAFLLMLAQAADPAVTTIAQGPLSAIAETKEVVARSTPDWNALWKSHTAAQPAPGVDFSVDMVVGVFLGTRPTGGFGVQIVGARRDAAVLVVEYVERRPGPDDIVTQVLTSPFHLVKLPRHDGAVRFQKR